MDKPAKVKRKPKSVTQRRPLVVGLTGGVGCGKTVVAKEFARYGAAIISGDEAGHDVVDKDTRLQRKLARCFGDDILTKRGINRRKLARRAFSSEKSRRQLNELVHPVLVKELTRRVQVAGRRPDVRMVVVDAALLVEWKMAVPVDILIAVWASRANRVRWLQKRGWTIDEIRGRMRAQLAFVRKKALADYVLANDGGLAALRRKAGRLWQIILDDH